MFSRLINQVMRPELQVEQAQSDWADVELKRLADDLAAKREKAIQYLGNKWILKGGQYTRSNVVLGQK